MPGVFWQDARRIEGYESKGWITSTLFIPTILLACWPHGGARSKPGIHMSLNIVSVAMAYTAGSMYGLSLGGTQKDVSSAGNPAEDIDDRNAWKKSCERANSVWAGR